MIGSLLGAVVRLLQLQKLMQLTRVQQGYAKAKAWFKNQPREIQMLVLGGVGLALVLTLFA
jgi:type II secretory pathway component PulM